MNIYKEDGYLDVDSILSAGYTFNIIIGPRGTGKTYGFAKWLLTDHNHHIVYMRRTSAEIEIAASDEFNVFKKLSQDTGIDIYFKRSKIGRKLFVGEDPRGFALPLSTFSNARGFDASEIEFLLFDEFVPEHSKRSKISEADTFFNAYETMNRNRELSGQDPIRCILCANSNNIDNDLFRALGLVNIISKLSAKHVSTYADPKRSLLVINIQDSPVSEQKRVTALYQLTGGDTDFDQMALGNTFTDLEEYKLKSASLAGARPLWQIGGLIFYKLPGGLMYGSSHVSGSPRKVYEDTQSGRAKFLMDRGPKLVDRYLKNKLYFETAADEVYFRNVCRI